MASMGPQMKERLAPPRTLPMCPKLWKWWIEQDEMKMVRGGRVKITKALFSKQRDLCFSFGAQRSHTVGEEQE